MKRLLALLGCLLQSDHSLRNRLTHGSQAVGSLTIQGAVRGVMACSWRFVRPLTPVDPQNTRRSPGPGTNEAANADSANERKPNFKSPGTCPVGKLSRHATADSASGPGE